MGFSTGSYINDFGIEPGIKIFGAKEEPI